MSSAKPITKKGLEWFPVFFFFFQKNKKHDEDDNALLLPTTLLKIYTTTTRCTVSVSWAQAQDGHTFQLIMKGHIIKVMKFFGCPYLNPGYYLGIIT